MTPPIIRQIFRWLSRLEKELNRQRQTLKPLKTLGFSVCPYYTVRAHLRHSGPTKRGRRENRLFHPGPFQCRVYPGYLRPRYHHRPAGGSEEDGRSAGTAAIMRKNPRAGMRWYPLQSLTQTQGEAVWVRYGSDMGQDEKPPRSREALGWFFTVRFGEKTVLSIQRIPPS